MSEFSYLWYRFRLQVACDKCGNPIVQQQLDGSPECGDCGEISGHSWENAMQFCGVDELSRAETGNKHLMGLMTAQSNSEAIAEINCHYCRKKLLPLNDIVLDGLYSCEHCCREIVFEPIKSFKDLVFYRFVNHDKIDPENLSLIAVRCASCGAPMEVDARKTNYPCTFCSVENILPPALRQKRVLDDIFIGARKKVFSFAELVASDDPHLVMNTLKTCHASTFRAETLNTVMLKFSDNEAIFNLMLYKIGHAFSQEVLDKLWETSRMPTVISESGKRLGKSKQEIANQKNRFSAGKTAKSDTGEKSFIDRIKSFFAS